MLSTINNYCTHFLVRLLKFPWLLHIWVRIHRCRDMNVVVSSLQLNWKLAWGYCWSELTVLYYAASNIFEDNSVNSKSPTRLPNQYILLRIQWRMCLGSRMDLTASFDGYSWFHAEIVLRFKGLNWSWSPPHSALSRCKVNSISKDIHLKKISANRTGWMSNQTWANKQQIE